MRNEHVHRPISTVPTLAVVSLLVGSGLIEVSSATPVFDTGLLARMSTQETDLPATVLASTHFQLDRSLTAAEPERSFFENEPFCTQEECDMYCGGMGVCINDVFCACY